MTMCDASLKQQQQAADLLNKGSFHEAEPLLREVVQSKLDQNNSEAFAWKGRLAECLIGKGDFLEACSFARSAAKGFKLCDPEGEDVLDCNYLLAECLYGQLPRLVQDAHQIAQETLKGLQDNSQRGPEHLTTLKCSALCAVLFKIQAKRCEAKALAQTTAETLDALLAKQQNLSAQGNRRFAPSEQMATLKVKSFLAIVLEDYEKSEGENMKKFAPDDEPGSVCSTRLPSKELQRRPSKDSECASD